MRWAWIALLAMGCFVDETGYLDETGIPSNQPDAGGSPDDVESPDDDEGAKGIANAMIVRPLSAGSGVALFEANPVEDGITVTVRVEGNVYDVSFGDAGAVVPFTFKNDPTSVELLLDGTVAGEQQLWFASPPTDGPLDPGDSGGMGSDTATGEPSGDTGIQDGVGAPNEPEEEAWPSTRFTASDLAVYTPGWYFVAEAGVVGSLSGQALDLAAYAGMEACFTALSADNVVPWCVALPE